jgi:hypothetical protein
MSCVLILNFCVFVYESHNFVLFLVWKLDLNLSFALVGFRVLDSLNRLNQIYVYSYVYKSFKS